MALQGLASSNLLLCSLDPAYRVAGILNDLLGRIKVREQMLLQRSIQARTSVQLRSRSRSLVHVTDVWNHIYLKRDRSEYETTKPVSGRPDSQIFNPSAAVLVWEVPYWDYKYMPHKRGMDLVYADNHAAWYKGNPKEYDRWAYHSRDGWERD